MATERRIEKLNILLREEISRIMDRELEFPENTLVTCTRVATSVDRKYAIAYFTVLGREKGAMEILQKNRYNIQKLLIKKVRIRPVPAINFALDEEEMRREGVEKSISELKRKGEI